jgi:hypothetical protein
MDVAAANSFPMIERTSHPAAGAAANDDGFGFDDLLDIVNPLQHIPIIGTIYRELTGDEIEAPARIAGGALFGGLVGLAGTLGTIAFEGLMGESTDEMITSLFKGDEPQRAQKAYAAAQQLTL